VSNLVLEFLGYDAGSVDDPSSIKGFWSPVEGGGPVRVYTQQISAKLYDVTVEHYELTKVTSTLGCQEADDQLIFRTGHYLRLNQNTTAAEYPASPPS
jgi:hypothetical protein